MGRISSHYVWKGNLYDTDSLHPDLPISMAMFLNYWEDVFPLARAAENKIKNGMVRSVLSVPYSTVDLLAPVPHASSLRKAYGFLKHVAAVRQSKQLEILPAFDQFPLFYLSNHNSIQGPGDITCMPDHFENLDFELQAAVVICKSGRNIPADEADEYIGGLMIMNGVSARLFETHELLLNLGRAKGNDFSTVTGPMLVTLDELEQHECAAKENHKGKMWNLGMRCSVNGVLLSEGNLSDMDWTFAEIIERSSYGVHLYPGDIIGSGAVGTGCLLDLNATRKHGGPDDTEQWLNEGDIIEMEIDGLGKLTNTIVKDESDFSILALKKKEPES
jgi:fumarylacetoacetate (FAA) hydrolase